MNKKLSIGLIIGGVLIIGMGSYLLYKRKKSSETKKKGDEKDAGVSTGGNIAVGTGTAGAGLTDTKTDSGTKTATDAGTKTVVTDTKTDSGTKTTTDSGNVNLETTTALKDAYDNLSFESGKDVIKSTSYAALDDLVDVLKKSNWGLKLEGHTDNTGDANWNMTLSKKRAEAVKKYLVNKGISASRITTEGYGITKPIADNKTPEGRAKNRRVEFKIVK